mgnify:CR=1 FL=1
MNCKSFLRILLFPLSFLLCSSFDIVTDEELEASGVSPMTLFVLKSDSVAGQTGEIGLPECHSSIDVPEDFIFIDKEQTRKLLLQYWGNREESCQYVLGAMIPSSVECFYQIPVAFVISYDNSGYVKDGDASSIDYDELLKSMQEAAKEKNKSLPEEKRFIVKGWAVTPSYNNNEHVLLWARTLIFNGHETVNYDMRILGKEGFVSINGVLDPKQVSEAERYGNAMVGSLHYDKGYAYTDFDPKKDRVSEWTIGGLVAGSILAKSGLLAKLGILLLKFWKLAVLAFFGIVAAIAKLFRRRNDEEVSAYEGSTESIGFTYSEAREIDKITENTIEKSTSEEGIEEKPRKLTYNDVRAALLNWHRSVEDVEAMMSKSGMSLTEAQALIDEVCDDIKKERNKKCLPFLIAAGVLLFLGILLLFLDCPIGILLCVISPFCLWKCFTTYKKYRIER